MSRLTTLEALTAQVPLSNIGYDQSQRWSYLDKANKRLKPGTEGDCSAIGIGLPWMAGYDIPDDVIATSKLCWTGNAPDILSSAKFTGIRLTGMTPAQITARAARGAAIIKDGHMMNRHPSSPAMWLSMNIDERGKIAGGRAGEQVPGECSVRPLWAANWTWLFLPPADSTPAPTTTAPLLREGSKGAAVVALQKALNGWLAAIRSTWPRLATDGVLGPQTAKTLRAFQAAAGLVADGIVGPATRAAAAKHGLKL